MLCHTNGEGMACCLERYRMPIETHVGGAIDFINQNSYISDRARGRIIPDLSKTASDRTPFVVITHSIEGLPATGFAASSEWLLEENSALIDTQLKTALEPKNRETPPELAHLSEDEFKLAVGCTYFLHARNTVVNALGQGLATKSHEMLEPVVNKFVTLGVCALNKFTPRQSMVFVIDYLEHSVPYVNAFTAL